MLRDLLDIFDKSNNNIPMAKTLLSNKKTAILV